MTSFTTLLHMWDTEDIGNDDLRESCHHKINLPLYKTVASFYDNFRKNSDTIRCAASFITALELNFHFRPQQLNAASLLMMVIFLRDSNYPKYKIINLIYHFLENRVIPRN